jgi:hypothetical protein
MTTTTPRPRRRPHLQRRPNLRRRPQRRPEERDRGSVCLTLAVLAVGMLVFAGLVFDGGVALDARGRAASLAQQASRAGVDALSPLSLRGPAPDLRVDPIQAEQAARRILTAGGATGEVSASGATVTVTAHVTRRAVILSAVGIHDLTGSATATATVVYGVTTGQRG